MSCYFENTQRGKIIVEKQTDPDGSDQSFEFTASYQTNFFLKDDEQNDSGWLQPGTYSVGEIEPMGWDLTSATCDDGSDPSAIDLQPGETVLCTFHNLGRGDLKITKNVIWGGEPDPDQEFTICIVGPAPEPTEDCQVFSEANGWTSIWTDLAPGYYTLYEVDPGPYWKVSYAPESQELFVSAGQMAEGTVTNEQQYLAYTPGFWKNHGPSAPSGHNAWVYTTYTVTHEVCTPFPAACSTEAFWAHDGTPLFADVNLFDALSLQGGRDAVGGAEILLRHAVAALLNADLTGYLDDQGLLGGFLPYPKTVAEVISEVNAALETGDRQTMLELAAQLDGINNGGSDYFDWTWPKP